MYVYFQGCHAAIMDRLYEYFPIVVIFLALDLFQVCPRARLVPQFKIHCRVPTSNVVG